MGRVLIIPLALLVMLLGAMYWSGGGVEKRAEFSFINRGDIYTLDLNQMSYMQDFRLTYAIREGLYGLDQKTFHPIPAGAVGFDQSPDKKVWTFHLRKDCKWSNGDPITARDYVFSWRRMLEDPGEYTYLFYYITNAKKYSTDLQAYYTYEDRLASYNKDALAYTRDLEDYRDEMTAWETANPRPTTSTQAWDQKRSAKEQELVAKFKPVPIAKPNFADVGIKAPDDLTFQVTLIDPVPYLLELVAFPPFYPRNEKSMEPFLEWQNKDKGQYSYRGTYTRPPYVVTNGPFVLKQWDFKRRLIMEKSPNYWDRAHVLSNSVEMVVTENPLSQFLMYESGEVDWACEIDGDLAAELKAKGRTDLRVSPAFGTAFLSYICTPKLPNSVAKMLDSDANPLVDIRVRQALTMAIDKQFIVDSITRMGEMPARTYLPPDGTLSDFTFLPGPFDQERKDHFTDKEMRKRLSDPKGVTGSGPGLPFDVQKARELLAAAGYPEGRGFPKLPIFYNTNSPTRQKICQVLKNQWKENLNIDVDIQGLEGKSFRDRVSNKDYAIATVAWYGDYPDASTFTDKYLSTSKQNDSAWINKKYDELCLQASKEPDAEKRLQLLEQAENMLDSEVPIAPLYHYVNVSLSRDSVHGVDPNPRNITVFKGIKVDR